MRSFFTLKRIVLLVVAITVVSAGLFAYVKNKNKVPDWVTDTVTRGEVANIVSVSGVVKAENTASLTFPTSGTVSEVLVKEGDIVVHDQILATLEQAELQAERRDAYAAVLIARANREELLRGPRSEERSVTDINVEIARQELERTRAVEAEKVRSAYRIFLSDALEALPVKSSNADTPPTISGTYTCADEGTYTLSVFRSGTRSGYSYRLGGLESGTYSAFTESPAPLGSCGLMIQFAADEEYSSGDWHITIPNARSISYATNLNAYQLATQEQANAVAAASQALEKAVRAQTLENAAPRDEALARAEANVLQAEARLQAVDARIEDRTLRAPFDGVVNSINIVEGEAATADAAVTLVAKDNFELTVRIPEIDITKVSVGQPAEVVFDARSDEVIPSSISFISPLATEIDGVAYFEAKLRFENPPLWLRGGLNADVDIIVDKRTDVLRIPKRFLVEESAGTYTVLVPNGTKTATTAVSVGFTGNDGFVEITGLTEGDTVIAP